MKVLRSELFCSAKNCAVDTKACAHGELKCLLHIKESRVAHRIPDAAGCSNDLRVAPDGPEQAEDPRVENRDDLGQASEVGDIGDTRKEFRKDGIDAAGRAFRLASERKCANAGSFPDHGAFDHLTVFEQARKDVSEHIWSRRRKKPQ